MPVQLVAYLIVVAFIVIPVTIFLIRTRKNRDARKKSSGNDPYLDEYNPADDKSFHSNYSSPYEVPTAPVDYNHPGRSNDQFQPPYRPSPANPRTTTQYGGSPLGNQRPEPQRSRAQGSDTYVPPIVYNDDGTYPRNNADYDEGRSDRNQSFDDRSNTNTDTASNHTPIDTNSGYTTNQDTGGGGGYSGGDGGGGGGGGGGD